MCHKSGCKLPIAACEAFCAGREGVRWEAVRRRFLLAILRALQGKHNIAATFRARRPYPGNANANSSSAGLPSFQVKEEYREK